MIVTGKILPIWEAIQRQRSITLQKPISTSHCFKICEKKKKKKKWKVLEKATSNRFRFSTRVE